MIDLERFIKDRQDALRSRPRNWRDDVIDWWRGLDSGDLIDRATEFFALGSVILGCACFVMLLVLCGLAIEQALTAAAR